MIEGPSLPFIFFSFQFSLANYWGVFAMVVTGGIDRVLSICIYFYIQVIYRCVYISTSIWMRHEIFFFFETG